jgi:uncharacterized protein YuzE
VPLAGDIATGHDHMMIAKNVPLRITLDDEADAAYIYLADEPVLGWHVTKTVSVPTNEIGGLVNLDVDAKGRMIGIEVLDARSLLPDRLLSAMSE